MSINILGKKYPRGFDPRTGDFATHVYLSFCNFIARIFKKYILYLSTAPRIFVDMMYLVTMVLIANRNGVGASSACISHHGANC